MLHHRVDDVVAKERIKLHAFLTFYLDCSDPCKQFLWRVMRSAPGSVAWLEEIFDILRHRVDDVVAKEHTRLHTFFYPPTG